MDDFFYTIATESEALYKEKGSKFIAHAFPVESEEEVKEKQEHLRKQYHDARHHCYAYILDPDGNRWRANDDGEPAHSAGDPILGQIKSRELTNTLVVVIRYFGGTKLGVSGLINAYKIAASDALDANKKVISYLSDEYEIETNYDDYNVIQTLHNLAGFRMIKEEFLPEGVHLHIRIFRKDAAEIAQLEKELYASKFRLIKED